MLPKRAIFPGSASATALESFPPSSSVPAADSNTGFPMFVDLVKVIRSIPGWDVIQGQRSWPPVTTLKTPDGSNSRIYSEMCSTVSGVSGDGLRTTVSPASNAESTFPKESRTDKFHRLTALPTWIGT
jgi:hypothetical protein